MSKTIDLTELVQEIKSKLDALEVKTETRTDIIQSIPELYDMHKKAHGSYKNLPGQEYIQKMQERFQYIKERINRKLKAKGYN